MSRSETNCARCPSDQAVDGKRRERGQWPANMTRASLGSGSAPARGPGGETHEVVRNSFCSTTGSPMSWRIITYRSSPTASQRTSSRIATQYGANYCTSARSPSSEGSEPCRPEYGSTRDFVHVLRAINDAAGQPVVLDVADDDASICQLEALFTVEHEEEWDESSGTATSTRPAQRPTVQGRAQVPNHSSKGPLRRRKWFYGAAEFLPTALPS